MPQQLSTGLWNCSVHNYFSFRRHLDCNTESECEDGRDETEHCPFSSPGCGGLLSLCNRCYKLVHNLQQFHSKTQDANKRANEYCGLFGARLGMPKCVYNWREILSKVNNSAVNSRMKILWLGLSSRDASLPNMYKQALTSEDHTVLYHSVKFSVIDKTSQKLCFVSITKSIIGRACVRYNNLPIGAICEREKDHTHEAFGQSRGISLNNADFPLQTKQLALTTCSAGHVVLTFLLCGSNQYNTCGQQVQSPCSFVNDTATDGSEARDSQGALVPVFTCSGDASTLQYTLVCDFRSDCQDGSDESFCEHRSCVKAFTCSNRQCLSYTKVCDLLSDCLDDSDEKACTAHRQFTPVQAYFPSPALINFDGARLFIATPLTSNDSCPGSHYRCPGTLNDCLPIHTRCNGMYDCVHHQDEEGCDHVSCPGLFRCRASEICLGSSHLCDGWPHCPRHDDELLCDVTCPVDCLCQGHSFLCRQPFPAVLFPSLRSLDASRSGMALGDVGHNVYLIHLVLAQCSLTHLPSVKLLNLRFLDLTGNNLQQANMSVFLRLTNLRALSLSRNPLVSLQAASSDIQQGSLTEVDLSHSTLPTFDTEFLSQFPNVLKLNLTFSSIRTINDDGFRFTPQLMELHLDGSPMSTFPADIFSGLSYLRVISTYNYKLCCKQFLPHNLEDVSCRAPKDEISSCEDLLQSEVYRGILWLISCLCLSGNIFCFTVRLCARKTPSSSGFSVFVTNLTMADFLMGVYIVIIGAADQQFRGKYLQYDDVWTNSVACKVAGFLSLVSSEVSALFIWLITLDRFVVLRFPFSTLRFERTSAAMACLLTWLVGCLLALLPLLPVTSHWKFYSQTGVCIPLPVTRRTFKGRVYSFSVMIVFNFILFLLISGGQAFIYWSVQSNTMKTDSTRESRDMTIARRLITVAVTDFLCWFPIGLCGILASLGTPIPGEINVALAILVLPLNSAINPFMYTFNTLIEKRRKSKEAEFLKWLESHADVLEGSQDSV
ncbi:hypothetical protein ACOMHN_064390 [Nucella lapillus]